ncbi:hypothetical protein [Hahella sp. CCB-MM4]|uniref:hypothetical protein n=1 Tax=Hahella sp. (strain CCB-MM4) TaxID=1926491 RepID=UPI001140906B|nr:hypothetical protein [Hahella sp. CCB-MM4]
MLRISKLLFLPIAFILVACQTGGLAFQIEYQDVEGLRKGAPLTHEEETIGTVKNIEYTDQGTFLVGVEMADQYRHLANQSAFFYISEDSSSNKIVELVDNDEPGAHPMIEEGQVIKGSNRITGMSQKFQNQFNSAVESLSNSIQSSWKNWKEETLEQQMAYLEEELNQLKEQAGDLSEKMRKDYETRILPELNKQIDALKKQLEELGRENELDGIEKKMDELNGLIEA